MKIVSLVIVSIIQLVFIVLVMSIPDFSSFSYAVIIILSIILVLIILSDNHKLTTSRFSWIVVVLTLPLIGIILYLVFGNGYMSSYKKQILENSHMYYSEDRLYEIDKNKLDICDQGLINYLDQMAYRTSHLHYGGELKAYNYGREKFNDLITDIRNAKVYIHIEYFIIKPGVLFDEISYELIKKVKQGIEVRIVSDFVGGRQLNNAIVNKLIKSGIKFAFFNELKISGLSKLSNFRDHRKIAVIDGKIAYTGGFNIGDEYIDLNPYYGHWEDFHLRIANTPAVLEYQTFFSQIWYFETKETLFKAKYYPEYNLDLVKKDTFIYPYVDGPDSPETFVRDMFLKIICGARKSIYIATPYLIPDETLLDALMLQANSGVDITIVTPGLPDKKYVKLATESYYRNLINVGVKIFEYNGFIHSKKILVDDDKAIVGTANFDMRSFNLSFEACTLLIHGQIIADIKEKFINTIQNSEDARDKIINQSLIKRIIQLILRIFTPLF